MSIGLPHLSRTPPGILFSRMYAGPPKEHAEDREGVEQPDMDTGNLRRKAVREGDLAGHDGRESLWRSEGFVNKTDDYPDDSPLDEVSRSLSQSEFQPDVQVHVVVQHIANRQNANENA